MPSFLQIGMAGEGRFCSPLSNFCLNGPVDLKVEKNFEEIAQNPEISIFEHLFHQNRASQEMP